MNTPKRRARITAITICLAVTFFASCSRAGDIKPPANPILSVGLGWAVVKDAYVRLKEKPSAAARDLDHLRRGGVYRVGERQLGASPQAAKADLPPDVWYELETDGSKGWVRDSSLDIYSSESQATKAAQSYN